MFSNQRGTPGPPGRIRTCLLGLALILCGVTPLAAQVKSEPTATLHPTTDSQAASELFFEALLEAENIGTAKAVRMLDQAVALDPGFGMALATKAFVDNSLSDEQRSSAFVKALGNLSDATPAEIAFATGLREWAVGNTKEARKLLESAAQFAPGDPHIAYFGAALAYTTLAPDESMSALRAVTERFPDHGPAFNILAYSLYQGGDKAGALDAVRKYVQLESDHWNAHDSYAELLAWEGRFDEALEQYEQVVEMDPTSVQGFAGQAEVLQMMGEGARAREKLAEALAIAATDAQTINLHRAVGHSFALDGDRQGAMRELTAAATLASERTNANLAALAHQEMALYEALLGRGTDVATHLQAAAAAGGPASRQAGTAALAYAFNGDMAAARAAAGELEAVARDDDSFQTLLHQVRAQLMLRDGDAAGAKAELAMADPSDLLTRTLLAETYKALGQKAAAATLRTDVMNDRFANLYSTNWVVARVKAGKIKM